MVHHMDDSPPIGLDLDSQNAAIPPPAYLADGQYHPVPMSQK
jgi:hypothetical protein